MRWRARTIVELHCALRAARPQLKRDPLGGAGRIPTSHSITRMLLELIATLCTGLFTGAAIYVNLVEHPARLEPGTAAAVKQWRPSYRRGTVMQASLAVVGSLAAVGAWLQGRGTQVLLAGLLIGLVVPFTLIVIFPTNTRLSDADLDVSSSKAAALLDKWNRLHAVRSAAGFLAFVLLLLHLGALV